MLLCILFTILYLQVLALIAFLLIHLHKETADIHKIRRSLSDSSPNKIVFRSKTIEKY